MGWGWGWGLGPCLHSSALEVASADAGCWFLLRHHSSLYPASSYGLDLVRDQGPYLGHGDCDGKEIHGALRTKAFPEHWATACCLPGPRLFPKEPVTAHVPPAPAA